MITLGVDLAAEAAGTAVAVLVWDARGAAVDRVALGVDDDAVRALVPAADVTGLDCPLGWPDAFVDLVVAHRAGTLAAPPSSGRPWRRTLALRATDRDVHARTGLTPLSVSADRIGHAAMRAAALLAALAEDGVDVARDGSGAVAEVYPAAALRLWGLPHRGYKRVENRAARDALVDALTSAAPWLDLGPHEAVCRAQDDVLDAVLCGLVARAVAVGGTAPPPDGTVAAVARREGWIHLPTVALHELV